MLNSNGCLHKGGVTFSTLWSKDFKDEFFRHGLGQWLKEHKINHDLSHVRELDLSVLPQAERELGVSLTCDLKTRKAILGVFDEGCMGTRVHLRHGRYATNPNSLIAASHVVAIQFQTIDGNGLKILIRARPPRTPVALLEKDLHGCRRI